MADGLGFTPMATCLHTTLRLCIPVVHLSWWQTRPCKLLRLNTYEHLLHFHPSFLIMHCWLTVLQTIEIVCSQCVDQSCYEKQNMINHKKLLLSIHCLELVSHIDPRFLGDSVRQPQFYLTSLNVKIWKLNRAYLLSYIIWCGPSMLSYT